MAPRFCAGVAALILSTVAMSFSYQFGSNPPIDYPRLLIMDTQDSGHIFEDSEITMATNICALQYQSSMLYSGAQGANLPSSPVSYLRIAALLLDSVAANKSRLASISQLLDVKLDPARAAKELRDQAKRYREVDDDAGAMMIIEQVNNDWTLRDRYWKQMQRQMAV